MILQVENTPGIPFLPPNEKNSQTSTVGDSGRFGMFPGVCSRGYVAHGKKRPKISDSQRPEPGGPSSAVHTPSTSASTPGAHLTHGLQDRCFWTTCLEFGGKKVSFLISKSILYVGDSIF